MPHLFDHEPSRQELFDAACVFFATSEGPSIVILDDNAGYNCRYRSKTGRVCAAGYFIPDEAYDPEMDGHDQLNDSTDMPNLLKHFGDKLPSWFRKHEAFLHRLQKIHDASECWTTCYEADARWVYAPIARRLQEAGRHHPARRVRDRAGPPEVSEGGADHLRDQRRRAAEAAAPMSTLGPLIERLFHADPLKEQMPDECWLAAQLSAVELSTCGGKGKQYDLIVAYYGREVVEA